MRWITYFILLYLAAAAQSASLLAFPYNPNHYWPRIEYLLILAVFYALYAAEMTAPLCAFIAGAVYDLTTNQTVGINAIPLSLTAWLITRVRLSIFREHFISQVLMTFLATVLFAILSIFIRSITRGSSFLANSAWIDFGNLLGNAIYSAIVAPFLMYLFFRFGPLLGFTPQGPRSRIHN